jgi:hypothetical protein
MENLIKALVKARSEFDRVTKDSNNPFFKSKYADLASVVAAITPALSANGLVVTQPIVTIDPTLSPILPKPVKTEKSESPVDVPMTTIGVLTQVWHESGEKLESVFPVPPMEDIQKVGSAITYIRRYALSSLLGVAPEDDDGNAASQGNNGNGNGAVKKPANGTISREEWLKKQGKTAPPPKPEVPKPLAPKDVQALKEDLGVAPELPKVEAPPKATVPATVPDDEPPF